MKFCIVLMFSVIVLSSCSKNKTDISEDDRLKILINNIEESAVELQHAVNKINKNKSFGSASKMKKAIQNIEDAQQLLVIADKAIEDYIRYVEDNKKNIMKDKKRYLIFLKIFTKTLSLKRETLNNYLGTYKNWIAYSANNFSAIRGGKSVQIQTYDVYLMKCKLAQRKYNTINLRYLRFINKFTKTHPKLVKKFKGRYRVMQDELGWR